MATLTDQLRSLAADKRIDLLGMAPIDRFAGIDARHHPASIFPEARTVLAIGKRIPRGALRGREEGTQMDLYEMYGRNWLVDRVLALATITVAAFLEEQGWEAVALQDLPPEAPPTGVAVRDGLPPPNVIVDVRDAAVRAGLGEIGYCDELLTPEFGPRQRLQLILTDAELDPSPLCATAVCDHCGQCATRCPLQAMSTDGDRRLDIGGRQVTVAAIDYSICRRCRNGASPNNHHPAGRPDRLAALCVRTCVDHLERGNRISNRFATAFRQRPAWQVDAGGHASLQAE